MEEKNFYVINADNGKTIVASSDGNMSRAVVKLLHDGTANYGADASVIEQIRAFRSDVKACGTDDLNKLSEINEKLSGCKISVANLYSRNRNSSNS